MAIAIIVHGGAWEIPDRLVARYEPGAVAAAALGHEILRGGGTALDAVEAAVRSLEDDPLFDAGRGSYLNRDGVPEHDAGIMDGRTLVSGAVASVVGVRNPVALARRVLDRGRDRLLVGPGAVAFAREAGVEIVDPEQLIVDAARDYWERHRAGDPRAIFDPRPRGTVGAVALDRTGGLAAATSTGGLPGKHPGRVGDSPLVGSGFFADAEAGGASATGHGEAIMTVALARAVVERIRAGAPVEAAALGAVGDLAAPRVDGRGGAIALDRTGRVGAACNTSRMVRAWIDGAGSSGYGVER
jgi:beta-aspartyl-peptidase (threonine type)